MRFLADECLDGRLIERLRRAGHDVSAVRDWWRGASDHTILEIASHEHRILVTEDKGFGDLVVRRGFNVPGLILMRYSQGDNWAVLERLLAATDHYGERLGQRYAVITPERTRVRLLDATPPRRR